MASGVDGGDAPSPPQAAIAAMPADDASSDDGISANPVPISIVTGFLCDSVFGGRMITTVLPFLAATGVAFGGWGAVCMAEKVSGKSLKSLHVAAMALVGFTIAGPDGVLGGAARLAKVSDLDAQAGVDE